jgi:hypothetical protein
LVAKMFCHIQQVSAQSTAQKPASLNEKETLFFYNNYHSYFKDVKPLLFPMI